MARIQCNVISYTLKRTVDINVILPSVSIPESLFEDECHHDYTHKYPVVYLLHGFGNNHAQWCGYSNVELYAEERKIAIVMISGENKNYLNQEQDMFYDFIENELIEYIEGVFPISSRKEDRFIAGLSMGGFGALYHGLKNTGKYSAIGAFSPAIQMRDVDVDLFKELDKSDANIPIYITCGNKDFLYELNLKFVDALKQKRVEYTWISEEGYEHEWRFWDLAIERFLDWIDRKDYYKNTKRKV